MHRFVSIAVMGAALVGCASDAEDNDAAPQEDVQGEDEAGTEESDAMDADALPDLPPLPERESYREWVKVEPEGRVCGDGSQYKFFAWFEED